MHSWPQIEAASNKNMKGGWTREAFILCTVKWSGVHSVSSCCLQQNNAKQHFTGPDSISRGLFIF